MTATTEYPVWAKELPKHLVADTVAGRPVIRYVYIDGIFWDSGCKFCQSRTALVEIFPDHEGKERCQSGGRGHCTCDTCF